MRSLADISDAELRELTSALERGRVRCPISLGSLAMAGFEAVAHYSDVLVGLSAESAIAVIDLVLAQRAMHAHALSLVWTGPRADGDLARDTSIVLRELFRSARREVFVAGYAFDHADEILAPLAEALDTRNVRCTVVLNIEERASVKSNIEGLANKTIRSFLSKSWPGKAKPTVYYDPRTCSPDVYASMHAKCVIVDKERVLISSANFTNRGQTRNIEVGVAIDDERFAGELLDQWDGLIRGKLLTRFRG